jgi:alanyl-tRNA synthetase
MNIEPLRVLGTTLSGQIVLGGAFQAADTLGLPLEISMEQAEQRGFVISLPHYFACALEHGWDDRQTFGKIAEALAERGRTADFAVVRLKCIAMFMEAAREMPGANAVSIAGRMRERLEEKAVSSSG